MGSTTRCSISRLLKSARRQALRQFLQARETRLVVTRDNAAEHRREVAPDDIHAVIDLESPMHDCCADPGTRRNQERASPASPGFMAIPT